MKSSDSVVFVASTIFSATYSVPVLCSSFNCSQVHTSRLTVLDAASQSLHPSIKHSSKNSVLFAFNSIIINQLKVLNIDTIIIEQCLQIAGLIAY